MKVNLEIDTVDESMEHSIASFKAMMTKGESPYKYKLQFVEKISEDGKDISKSELLIAENRMRMRRTGGIESDFLYEQNLVHNTAYKTPYGTMPISVDTQEYTMCENGESHIHARAIYKLVIAGEEPMAMDVNIRITPNVE